MCISDLGLIVWKCDSQAEVGTEADRVLKTTDLVERSICALMEGAKATVLRMWGS